MKLLEETREEIVMYGGIVRHSIVLVSAIAQEGTVTGQATVRADGTGVVLGYFDWNDTVQIVAEPGYAEDWPGYVTVPVNGLYAHMPERACCFME